MRAMKPLCSGINVSTNAGSNARASPDLPDQQKQLTGRSLAKDRSVLGALLETFVANEVLRLATWSDVRPTFHHYRDKDQDEVDIVLEDESGDIIGFEVKAAATVTAQDFKGLRKVAAVTGKYFKAGWVLYDGEKILPFGDRIAAVPLSCLWSG